jgi:uncharacterized membrane protein
MHAVYMSCFLSGVIFSDLKQINMHAICSIILFKADNIIYYLRSFLLVTG